MLQRGLVLLIMAFGTYFIIDNPWWTLYIAFMNMLIFSFFHNGAMYMQRNKMEPKLYIKGWWAQSETSTAALTKLMHPISRTIQAILGVIGYVIHPFIN